MSEISEALQAILGIKGDNKIYIIEASVISVNEDERTCIVDTLSDSFEGKIEEIYLSAQPNDGIIQIPSIGSIVKVCVCSGIDFPFIIQFSDLDKVVILTDISIQFNDGSFGGLTKSNELKTQLDKTNDVVNAIVNALTTWNPVPNDGGSALKAFAISQLSGKAVGDYSNIKNNSITHG